MSKRVQVMATAAVLVALASGCGTERPGAVRVAAPPTATLTPGSAVRVLQYDRLALLPLSRLLGSTAEFRVVRVHVRTQAAPITGLGRPLLDRSDSDGRMVYTPFEVDNVTTLRGATAPLTQLLLEGGTADNRQVQVADGPLAPIPGADAYAIVSSPGSDPDVPAGSATVAQVFPVLPDGSVALPGYATLGDPALAPPATPLPSVVTVPGGVDVPVGRVVAAAAFLAAVAAA